MCGDLSRSAGTLPRGFAIPTCSACADAAKLSVVDHRETVATVRRSSGALATSPYDSPTGPWSFLPDRCVAPGPALRILWPPQAPDGLTLAVYRAKPHVGADYGPADR